MILIIFKHNTLNNNVQVISCKENFTVFIEKNVVCQTNSLTEAILIAMGLLEIFSLDMPKNSNILKLLQSKAGQVVRVNNKTNRIFKALFKWKYNENYLIVFDFQPLESCGKSGVYTTERAIGNDGMF